MSEKCQNGSDAEDQATEENIKRGGPYTEEERFKRRQEVYTLHFEQGLAATKIAEILGVNRNTVNDDIQYWYEVLADEWHQADIYGFMQSKLERLESTRARLLTYLQNATTIEQKLAIERMIAQIDIKVAQLAVHIHIKL